MASSVFYKFKSQKEESKVSFDGTGISVFELKKEIILANNLGKSSDFDLVVLDGSSTEGLSHPRPDRLSRSYLRILAELRDDSHMIPRSSSVVVKRVPSARPGKGKAAMYIGAPGTSATPESKPNSQSGNSSWTARSSISRRFDKEYPLKPTTVRTISLFSSLNYFFLRVRRSTSHSLPPRVWVVRTTRRPRWPLCSRLSPRSGRRLRKKCHSWCRLWRFFPCPVVIFLIHIFAVRSIAGRSAFSLPAPLSPSQSDPGLHQSTWDGFGRSRRQAV
jgi:hypothetical protein